MLLFFFRVLSDRAVLSELKILALRFIVTPTLVSTFEKAKSTDEDATTKTKTLAQPLLLPEIFNSAMVALFMRSALDAAGPASYSFVEFFFHRRKGDCV